MADLFPTKFVGPVLSDEQERERQRRVAQQNTQSLQPPTVPSPHELIGLPFASRAQSAATRIPGMLQQMGKQASTAGVRALGPVPPAPFANTVDPLFQLNVGIRQALGAIQAKMPQEAWMRMGEVSSGIDTLLKHPGFANQQGLLEIIDGFNRVGRMFLQMR